MSAASAPNLLKYFLAASAQSLNTMIFKSNIGTSDGYLLLALSSKAFWKGLKSQRLRGHVCLPLLKIFETLKLHRSLLCLLSLFQPLLKILNFWSRVCMSGRDCLCSKYTERLKVTCRTMHVCLLLAVCLKSKLPEGRAQSSLTLSAMSVYFAQNLRNFKETEVGRCLPPLFWLLLGRLENALLRMSVLLCSQPYIFTNHLISYISATFLLAST